jgi:RNA polymerase sigma factor (sigma-70 family)
MLSSRASPADPPRALRPGMTDAARREFFAAEVERLTNRLFGTAVRFTRDRDEAEELVAETLAKAWAKLGELRDPAAFEGWIQRILSNTFVSRWRHRQACPEVPAELDDGRDGEPFSLFEQLHQPFLLWWSNPEEAAVRTLLREDIDRALDALPDPFRVAVVLVDVQGNSYAEAAAILGVPVGTVRSRLARARSQLQRSLWQHALDAGLFAPRQEERIASDGEEGA